MTNDVVDDLPQRSPLLIQWTKTPCFTHKRPFPHPQSRIINYVYLGNQNLGSLNDGILGQAQAPAPASYEPMVPLILAGNQTKRPDILRRFRIYHDGWDISNKHYWALSDLVKDFRICHSLIFGASVAFTGVVGFVISLIWLISFDITLLIHHCFGWRISFKGKGSKWGCIFLLVGQLDLHSEVLHTLHYVVNQSDNTAQILRNVSDYLSIAKAVDVPQFNLPQSTMKEIDDLSSRLSSGAETLTDKTNENSVKVLKLFSTRSALITVASVMLVLAVVGIVLSILGCQNVIHM
ncbi:uncharacterized protein LOC130808522 [Amaranthus tricolor]|uniref:uncharacterized protein LOC130808522 n=1 Tax=Amaranthus tricolor TaxID=29722 RepID=UPI0025861D60|nr:uncharacterized protein LOC130808522 [Amaranthus tricolor]